MLQDKNQQSREYLQKQILNTFVYFDIQDHPLTALEVFKYLLRENWEEGQAQDPVAFMEVVESLENDFESIIDESSGFYFLQGRSELVEKRLHNNYYASARLKRAKNFLPLARHIPFVRGVALTGSEALNNSKKGSDIDLLVLTAENRMWLARIFISFFFQVLGMRRHGNAIENRFCLNHYIWSNKRISSDQNTYTAIEYSSLISYFGGKEIYKFQMENFAWIKNFLAQPQIVEYKNPAPSFFQKFWEWLLGGRFGDMLERAASKPQIFRIKPQEHITVEKDELSFHPGSKGQQILRKLQQLKTGS